MKSTCYIRSSCSTLHSLARQPFMRFHRNVYMACKTTLYIQVYCECHIMLWGSYNITTLKEYILLWLHYNHNEASCKYGYHPTWLPSNMANVWIQCLLICCVASALVNKERRWCLKSSCFRVTVTLTRKWLIISCFQPCIYCARVCHYYTGMYVQVLISMA